MTFDQFVNHLKKSPPGRVTIVAGDDPVTIDEAVRVFIQTALAGDDPTGGLARFDGKETEPAVIFDELRTLPLLGSRRVVVVDEAAALVERAAEALARYAARPSQTAFLLLVARDVTAPSKTFKALGKTAAVVTCPAPRRQSDRLRWLVARAAAEGKTLAGPDARLLLDLVGDDLGALAGAVVKLATYVGPRRKIARPDIEALVAPTRVEPIYQLGDAVTARDLPRALRLTADLLDEGVEAAYIVATLRAHLRRFWQVKRHRQAGHSPADAARDIGAANRAWLIEKLYPQTDRFSDAELARCFRELLKADVATKTGAMPDAVALTRFVMAACGKA